MDKVSLEDIPFELVTYALMFLDGITAMRFSMINKKYYKMLTQAESLWQKYYLTEQPRYIDRYRIPTTEIYSLQNPPQNWNKAYLQAKCSYKIIKSIERRKSIHYNLLRNSARMRFVMPFFR